jgi:type II restriction/modification system DNA methylase subunit YeeA
MSSNAQLGVQLDIDEVLLCIRGAVMQSHTEEDVRVRVSNCIEEKILKPLGITQVGKYEYTLVSGARVDALYGHVIIEYKAPGKLSRDSDIQRAKEQVIGYIMAKAESKNKSAWGRYLGVIISDRIAFVRYDKTTDAWVLRGPYEINREAIIKLIEALRGLSRKSLTVDNIVADFGPGSLIAKETVALLYKKVTSGRRSKRTEVLFNDWMRLFKQTTGYDPSKLKGLKGLVKEYIEELDEEQEKGDNEKENENDKEPNKENKPSEQGINYDALIFAIHTYYALIMKLIAAEVAYLYGSGKFYRSYTAELDDAYTRNGVEGLKTVLRELEEGGIFKKLLNIENFLEGDYFSWYLEELDEELAKAIAEIARTLSDYEIATPQLEPEFARDLLKRLYQNLVPRDIRHSLGEYYTPDWLAELILNEVGLSLEDLMKMGVEDPLKPLKIKVLDPACGSGTFLVLYISRLRRYAEEHYMLRDLPNYVLENVVGYDLNPLAVLAARTNYLLAIADLLPYVKGSVEIPIYLADSIMIEEKYEIRGDRNVYVLKTVEGEFKVPTSIASNQGLLRGILNEAWLCLINKCSVEDFRQRIRAFNLDQMDSLIILDLYGKLLDLERQGKDRVWISILRNAFAPILKGKFDYVVGNPPWVNWENLPEQYREVSKNLWIKYGLAETISTGGFKRDLSMLFLARSFDRYLKEGGKLGFLITFTVFKTQAGAGFRNFLAKNTRIHAIHDLVTLMPFEGATNRAGAIIVEKVCDLEKINNNDGCKAITEVRKANMSGIKHVVWVGKQVDPDTPLEEVLKTTRRYEIVMIPLKPNDAASPWMQITPNIVNAVRKVIGRYYEAHEGIVAALNQVYYVKVLGRTPDGMLIVTNPPESGHKKRVRQVEAKVEPDLVYPLIRGEDVRRWYVEFKDRYVIVPHNPRTGQPYRLNEMITRFPNAFSYLNEYRDELKKRAIKPFLSLRDKIKKAKSQADKERAEEELDKNFYILDNIGAYTFAPYKVVWKRIAGAITGKAVSFACAVVEPINGRPVIPDDGTILVETETPDEAYYIAGVLNSVIARSIIASYTYELRQETHIIDVIRIPKFDPSNNLHRRIAELSRRAHELARCIYASSKPSYCAGVNAEDELRKVEDELDSAVARLYGLSEDELREFRRLMAILSGEEVPGN